MEGEEVLGWAALTPVSHRCVYGGVSEVSIYIGAAHRGKGVGKKLFQALVDASEEAGFWTLESIVFQDNVPSINPPQSGRLPRDRLQRAYFSISRQMDNYGIAGKKE